MINLILSIILSIVCFGNILLIGGQGEGFKFITLLSGPVNDLGWNYMLNEGRVNVGKALNIGYSKTYIVDGENDTTTLLLKILKEDPEIDLILCTSLGHLLACNQIATMFQDITKTQWINRQFGTSPVLKNMVRFTFNYATVNYFAGLFAGQYTKSNAVGFLSHGIKTHSNDSYVYAFWLGAKLINPDIEFYYYNIGSFIDPDKSIRATNKLIDLGVDVVGSTLDDSSTGDTVISRGLQAIGTNGFPQGSVRGNNMAFSYVYNWTKIFYPLVKNVIEEKKNNESSYYGDVTNDTNLDMFTFEYSFTVDDSIKKRINEEIVYFKNRSRATFPTNCNKYMEEYMEKYNFAKSPTLNRSDCLSGSNFFFINEPFPGMTYLGYYQIQNIEVLFPSSIKHGISITSGILIAMVLLIMAGIYKHRHTDSIQSASPVFLNFITLGAISVYVGIIVWVSPISTHSCNARLWLVTLGFSTLIGSLVVKNIRIWLIFDNDGSKTVKITNYHLYPFVAACLLVNIVLMIILTTVGDNKEIDAQGIDELDKYEFMKICKMNDSGASTLYTILSYFGVLLLSGVFISWKIRIIDIEELNESRAIAYTLYTIGFCLFVIVPLMIAPQDKQSETIILCIAGLFMVTLAILIIFIPKFYKIYGPALQDYNNNNNNNDTNISVSSIPIETTIKINNNNNNNNNTSKDKIILTDFSDGVESSIGIQPNYVLADFSDSSE